MREKPDVKMDGHAKIYDPDKVSTKEAGLKPAGPGAHPAGEKQDKMSMREMAARDTRYHLQPMPEAQPAEVDPFPAPVMRGLWIGALAGLVLGLFWAALMLNGMVVIGGWEGLFSMTPGTFYTFWALLGLAFGGLIAGVAAILMNPGPREEDAPSEHPSE